MEDGLRILTVDGLPLEGWDFRGFSWGDGEEHYVGMAAAQTTSKEASYTWTDIGNETEGLPDFIKQVDAIRVLENAQRIHENL